MDFAQWLFDDVKPYQFWRRGEKEFSVGILFADMADYPSWGEDSMASKHAEDIADKTSSSKLTMWLLKRSAKRFKTRPTPRQH